MTIGETILQQMGGGRLVVMTGVNHLVQGDNWLSMKLPKNHSKANYLKITLNGKDLYDMEFKRYRLPSVSIRNGKAVMVKEVNEIVARFEDVFCDDLQPIFEDTTWLLTKLF